MRESTRRALQTLLFIIVVPGTVTILVPYELLKGRVPPSFGGGHWLGLPLIGLGAAACLLCAWDFAFSGLGTPAPIAAPRFLVRNRLYRWSRNPMYAGVLLVLFGEALLSDSLALAVYALVMALGFHAFVRFYEEPTLRKKFGVAYEDYCRAVPRWIPRRPRPRRPLAGKGA
jgi:protein-S-isoprenylcysteine O-methyltransferase Ste14